MTIPSEHTLGSDHGPDEETHSDIDVTSTYHKQENVVPNIHSS